MKKWASLLGAFILGITVASSAGTVAAQVQSLIGQKVTGELKVVVNGKELADKGAVINGKTNAPVRAITDALGGTLKLEGHTINITTGTAILDDNTSKNSVLANNKYMGRGKDSLEKLKESIQKESLIPMEKEREEIVNEIAELKRIWGNPDLTKIEKQLAEYDSMIDKRKAELTQIDEALQALEK